VKESSACTSSSSPRTLPALVRVECLTISTSETKRIPAGYVAASLAELSFARYVESFRATVLLSALVVSSQPCHS
jgi:hypothetical protein